jgi:hypothetical protein
MKFHLFQMVINDSKSDDVIHFYETALSPCVQEFVR